MLTREFNYMRKSQRVDIPLLVQIDGHLYETADWSMTGVGVVGFNEKIEPGSELDGKLILPIVGASITINVKIICRNVREDKVGFEFVDISNNHKRVLRHYIELSIEGKLDNIEDLFSDFSAPDIETPIQEALNITEEEQTSLLRKFRSRAFLTLFAGIVLLGYISITLLYNFIFVHQAVGVASGDLVQIPASTNGTLKKNYVKVGDHVRVNDILFDINEDDLLNELKKNKEQIDRQTKLLDQLNLSTGAKQSSNLLALLQEEYEKKDREYKNAQELYSRNIISIKDYQFVENSLSSAKINYIRELESRQGALGASEEKKNVLTLNLEALKTERAMLRKQLEELRIKSPINGVVFTVDHFSGEYLSSNDIVVTLATRQNPFILFKLPSIQSGKTHLGMKAKVHSYETEETYEGVVSSIGYSAINPRSTLLQEVSLDQTVIKVDLVGGNIEIPLNSRVQVWVKKDIPILTKLAEFLRKSTGKEDAETIR